MNSRFRLLLASAIYGITASFVTAQDLSNYESALGSFEALIKSESRLNKMPRQADPNVTTLLDNLTDARRHLEITQFEPHDFPRLIKACTRTNGILLEYILFSVNRDPNLASAVAAGQDSGEFAKLIDQSFSSFQPEMGRLESFVVLCTARVISLADESPIKNAPAGTALDSFHKSIYYLRRSAYKIYINSLRRIITSSLPADYKAQLAAALSSSAAKYAAVFTPELRRELVRLCDQPGVNLNDELRLHINGISQEMSSLTCKGLCPYGNS